MVGKRLILPVMMFLALFLIASVAVQEIYASGDFAGGDGTEINPYQVATAYQLDNIRNYSNIPDLYFVQTADICLADFCQDQGPQGWWPIDYTRVFQYDGNGYAIYNLFMNHAETYEDDFRHFGLFGHCEGARFKNIRLLDVDITVQIDGEGSSSAATGGLVGSLGHYTGDEGTIIENCHVSGTVIGENNTGGLAGYCEADIISSTSSCSVKGFDDVGGLVGHSEGEIISSSATGDVEGVYPDSGGLGDTPPGCTGGLVGIAEGAITGSYATGSVTGMERVGGLVGRTTFPSGVISLSYATGDVSALYTGTGYAGQIGGLVGFANAHINRSFATGTVEGENRTGGLVGDLHYSNIRNCYARGDVSGYYGVGGLVGYSTDDQDIINSYSTGAVVGSSGVGGLIGYYPEEWISSAAVNCYYDTITSGQDDDDGRGTPRTTFQMQQGSANDNIDGNEIYTGWSTDVWSFTPTDKYPWLINNPKQEPATKDVTRLSGDDRYITAVEISKSGWTTADTVLLARGDDYADALAGVPLAYHLDAPILLTPTKSLDSATEEEIERLGAGEVILLGGTTAISDDVKGQLEVKGLSVDRIAGSDRYETAAEVAERLSAEGVNFDTAFIAVGTNFADALAASSYAAMRGEPILLVGKNTLPPATSKAISDLGITSTYVCGGEAAVSDAVFSQLPNPKRISGNDRYLTALALAEEFLPVGTAHVGIATGLNYPDAVAGGVWAAKNYTGILLVNGKASEPGEKVEDFLEDRGIKAVTLFGGPAAVSSEMAEWFEDNFGD